MGTDFSQIFIEFETFSFKSVHFEMSYMENVDHFLSTSVC